MDIHVGAGLWAIAFFPSLEVLAPGVYRNIPGQGGAAELLATLQPYSTRVIKNEEMRRLTVEALKLLDEATPGIAP